MKISKETRTKIYKYCIDCIIRDDCDGGAFKDDKEALTHCYNRFISEFDHEIKRNGYFKAFENWLQGLAIDIDFYNSDILRIAKEWEQNPKTASQEDKIISQWFGFLTNHYFKLFKKYKIGLYEVVKDE